MKVGGTLQRMATDGGHHDVTKSVQWQSGDWAKAAVDANGLATALNPGQVTIIASLNGAKGNVVVAVLPSPAGRPSGTASIPTTPLPAPSGR